VIPNTDTVTSGTPDPVLGNNVTSTANTVGPASSDLKIAKTQIGTPVAGSELTYTLTATNLGPSDPTSGVTVTDTIPTSPSGTTFQRVTPPNGWTCNQPADRRPGTTT